MAREWTWGRVWKTWQQAGAPDVRFVDLEDPFHPVWHPYYNLEIGAHRFDWVEPGQDAKPGRRTGQVQCAEALWGAAEDQQRRAAILLAAMLEAKPCFDRWFWRAVGDRAGHHLWHHASTRHVPWPESVAFPYPSWHAPDPRPFIEDVARHIKTLAESGYAVARFTVVSSPSVCLAQQGNNS